MRRLINGTGRVRLGGILAPTTNRKSLYNRQYGVFTRDRSSPSKVLKENASVLTENICPNDFPSFLWNSRLTQQFGLFLVRWA